MRIGIIGGGLMGIALAYYLTQAGETVTLLEQDQELGGLNGQFQLPDGLKIARYQHAILPKDQAVRSLCAELGLENDLVFRKAFVGLVYERRLYAMTSIRDFLAFPPLTLADRIRLGNTFLRARIQTDWRPLDQRRVKDWLIEVGGVNVFEQIWQPMLEAKFDGVYDTLPATYIWAWIHRMTTMRRVPTFQGSVGYLQRGHYSLIEALAKLFTQRGGRIETQVRVREIVITGGALRQIRTHTGVMEFDVVVAAVASPMFARLIPGADEAYLERVSKSKYLGLICPVIVLKKPLSPYWTLNLTDPSNPFSTVIETPHPEQSGYRIVYLPRYTAPDNDWMGVSNDDIREAWLSHLKGIFPDFRETDIMHFEVSRSRYAEPVYSLNMLNHAPGVQTPYTGLYLANSSQVYPDLPTSEATIVHARRAADVIRRHQRSPSDIPA
jgi:protoporphyrinogen oxidase